VSGRRALLIGIPEYEKNEIEDIPVIREDLALMVQALESLDFATEVVGLDAGEPPTGVAVEERLLGLLDHAAPQETLLVYFTGHGSLGPDYTTRLWPRDASISTPRMRAKSLVPIDLRKEVAESEADLVILFVDACRLPEDSGGAKAFYAAAETVRRHQLLIVYGCALGQVCQYVTAERSPTGRGFSLFTRSLVDALAAGPCTIQDLLDRTQEGLDTLVKELNAAASDGESRFAQQTLHKEVNTTQGSQLWALSLTGESFEDEQDPWYSLVTHAGLWELSEERDRERWVAWAGQVAEWCSVITQASADDRTGDPWAHPDHLAGVLETLEERVDACKGLQLTPPEAALLAVAPLVREAVIAQGLSGLASADVHDMTVRKNPSESRSQLQRTHHRHAALASHGARLDGLGLEDQAGAIAWWLAYRCLFRDPSFWMAPPSGMADGFPKPPEPLHDDLGTLDLVWRLACAIHGDPCKLLGPTDKCGVPARWEVGRGAGIKRLRPRMLGILLSLAGRLSLDLRNAPEVLVSHIGLSDPLDMNRVAGRVLSARWTRAGGAQEASGRSLALRLRCRHPAVDHALRLMVQAADDVLREIQGIIRDVSGLESLAQGLPERLTADELLPESVDGAPAYQTPHVRFELGHKEVRQLLMGERLYGEPELAVRELYQNALDALRYREARERWLQRPDSKVRFAPVQPPSIRFHQSEADGRPYLLCVDNGVGMDLDTVRECFAQAGKRFCEMPSYLEESWRWKKAGLAELHPNSRFGVGVFSYFMLADEIEVETCRFLESGERGPVLSVKISSAGALFRIKLKEDRAWLEDTGTAIRLWLKPQESSDAREDLDPDYVDCIAGLQELLMVAEYPTSATGPGLAVTWQPGELRRPLGNSPFPSRDEQCQACQTREPGVWWVTEEGGFLSDGLTTKGRLSPAIVDLRGGDERELSVDRKTLLSWNREATRARLLRAVPDLVAWGGLTFVWLWALDRADPLLAIHVEQALIRLEPDVSIPLSAADRRRFRLADVGIWQADRRLLGFRNRGATAARRSSRFPSMIDGSTGMESITPVLLQRIATWVSLDRDLMTSPVLQRMPMTQVRPGRLGSIQSFLLRSPGRLRLVVPSFNAAESLTRAALVVPRLLSVEADAVIAGLEGLGWCEIAGTEDAIAALQAGLHQDDDLVALLLDTGDPEHGLHISGAVPLYPDLVVAYARRTGRDLRAAAERLMPLAIDSWERAALSAAPACRVGPLERAILEAHWDSATFLVLAHQFKLALGELTRTVDRFLPTDSPQSLIAIPDDLVDYTPDQTDRLFITSVDDPGGNGHRSHLGLRRLLDQLQKDDSWAAARVARLRRLGVPFDVALEAPVAQARQAGVSVGSVVRREPLALTLMADEHLARLDQIFVDDLDLVVFPSLCQEQARHALGDDRLLLDVARVLEVAKSAGLGPEELRVRLLRSLAMCNDVQLDELALLLLSAALSEPIPRVVETLRDAGPMRPRDLHEDWHRTTAERPVVQSDLDFLLRGRRDFVPMTGRTAHVDAPFLRTLEEGEDPVALLEDAAAIAECGIRMELSTAALYCLVGKHPEFLHAYLDSPALSRPPPQTELDAVAVLPHDPLDAKLLWWDQAEGPTESLKPLSLLRCSVLLQESYEASLLRARRLAPLGVAVEQNMPSPGSLIALAAELKRPLGKVFATLPVTLRSVLIPSWTWLGCKDVPSALDGGIATVLAGPWVFTDLRVLELLSHDALAAIPEERVLKGLKLTREWLAALGLFASSERLNPAELVIYSKTRQQPLAGLHHRLPLDVWPLGVAAGELPNIVADRVDLVLISRDCDGVKPFVTSGLTMSHVLQVADATATPVPELVARARALAPLGFGIRDSPGGLADSWTDDSEGPEQPDARPSVEPELDA